jgi:hypothetical protein
MMKNMMERRGNAMLFVPFKLDLGSKRIVSGKGKFEA